MVSLLSLPHYRVFIKSNGWNKQPNTEDGKQISRENLTAAQVLELFPLAMKQLWSLLWDLTKQSDDADSDPVIPDNISYQLFRRKILSQLLFLDSQSLKQLPPYRVKIG